MASKAVVIGGVVVGAGVLAVATSKAMASEHEERNIWLINGKRYAIVARIAGAGWDASLFPGFCEFSQPVITGQNPGQWTEVQFTAQWCAANLQWDVPENIAVDELD